MSEHVHGCLNCRPDMVPGFNRDDPRYHGAHCAAPSFRVKVDGVEPGYTNGAYEGAEGWALLASRGFVPGSVHECPNCTIRRSDGLLAHYANCVEPIFGNVEVIHDCPRRTVAQVERLAAAFKPLVPESVYLRAMYGEQAG